MTINSNPIRGSKYNCNFARKYPFEAGMPTHENTGGTRVYKVVNFILTGSVFVYITLLLSSVLFVFILRFVNPPFTTLMMIRNDMKSAQGNSPAMKLNWVPLKSIPSSLKLALIVSEDFNFFSHHGFDFDAIIRAIDYNRVNDGKKFMGASTISQQTAKNVFLWPERSWMRKFLEAYFTSLIEFTWGKRRILEVYLNVIELGPGVFGVEAASMMYFHKHVSALTRDESVLLATIAPNPLKMDLFHPTDFILWKKDDIIFKMRLYCKWKPKYMLSV